MDRTEAVLGAVISSGEHRIVIRLPYGDTSLLPPDLRSAGEVVTNPDFLSV